MAKSQRQIDPDWEPEERFREWGNQKPKDEFEQWVVECKEKHLEKELEWLFTADLRGYDEFQTWVYIEQQRKANEDNKDE